MLQRMVTVSLALHHQKAVVIILMYTLMLDNAEFRDSTNPNLLVIILPNPSDFALASNEPIEIGSSPLILIRVRYLTGSRIPCGSLSTLY